MRCLIRNRWLFMGAHADGLQLHNLIMTIDDDWRDTGYPLGRSYIYTHTSSAFFFSFWLFRPLLLYYIHHYCVYIYSDNVCTCSRDAVAGQLLDTTSTPIQIEWLKKSNEKIENFTFGFIIANSISLCVFSVWCSLIKSDGFSSIFYWIFNEQDLPAARELYI